MNIINIEHISKLFGDKLIFDDASFGLQEGDKVGIVGINGTGKSTLLRIVAGDETPDSGQIIRQNNLKMAYLPQTPEFPKDATVLSYALSGDEEDWQVQSNLVQLGITEYDAKIDTLSGGQRRKVALAKVLASDFDVLILDEPTNHLDNAMLSWLEDYLKITAEPSLWSPMTVISWIKCRTASSKSATEKCTATIPTIPVFWN